MAESNGDTLFDYLVAARGEVQQRKGHPPLTSASLAANRAAAVEDGTLIDLQSERERRRG